MIAMKNESNHLQLVDTEYQLIQDLIEPISPSGNVISKCIMKLKNELVKLKYLKLQRFQIPLFVQIVL